MQHFSQLFQENKARFGAHKTYLDALIQQGFPTRRYEDWKYTRVTSIVDTPWKLPVENKTFEAETCLSALKSKINLNLECDWVLIVDGKIVINKASNVLQVSSNNTSLSTSNKSAFVLLNAVFSETGFSITVPDNVHVERPVHIVHYVTDKASEHMFNLNNQINMGNNAKLTLIETFISEQANCYWQNQITTIRLAAQAHLNHYKFQQESLNAFHLGTTFIDQKEKSNYDFFSLALGARISRQEIHQTLEGYEAKTTSKGIYLIKDKQLADHHLKIHHCNEHTRSDLFYKGIMNEQSHGVFNGKVIVAPHAQKTDAQQANRNLLLSKNADIDTKPELEIYADDVKCSHGATVGQLDDNALFYLISRGIDKESAKALLMYAFAADVIETLEQKQLKQHAQDLILAQLPQGARIKEMLHL